MLLILFALQAANTPTFGAIQDPSARFNSQAVRELRDRLRLERPEFLIDTDSLESATAHGSQVEIKLSMNEFPVRELEYGDLTPDGWKDASARVSTRGDQAILKLDEGVPFVLRPKTTEILRLGIDPIFSSGTLLHATGETAADGTPIVRQWSLFLATLNDPVIWNEDQDAYATSIVVGAEAEDRSGASQALPQPITVQFFLEGRGLEVEPTRLRIDRSGAAGYVEAALLCRSHTVEDAAVRARGSLGEQRWSFDVEPALGALRIEVSPRSVLGFGLEKATITVRRQAEDEEEWIDDAPLTVNLTTDRGTLPATIEIPAGASLATLEFRSASVGPIEIIASANGVSSEAAELLYTWPFVLLVICLVLGGIGGLMRAFQEEHRLSRERRSGRRLLLRAAGGAFTAFVIVPAAILGISSYNLDANSEAGAAVLAALAGWTGTMALTALARRVGIDPTKEEEVPSESAEDAGGA